MTLLSFLLCQTSSGSELRFETWVAAGGTYGLIIALVYAVRYLVKRDESSTQKLIEALGSTVNRAASQVDSSNAALTLAAAKLTAMEVRIAALEQVLHARCPFLGEEHHEAIPTAKAIARNLLKRDGSPRAEDGAP